GASVAVSTAVRKTRTAVFLTYVILAGYLLTSSCCFSLPVEFITAGNPFLAAARVFNERFGPSGTDNVPGVLIEYTAIHTICILISYFVAAGNLRLRCNPEEEKPPVVVVQVDSPAIRLRLVPETAERLGIWDSGTVAMGSYRARFYPQVDPPPKPKPAVGND